MLVIRLFSMDAKGNQDLDILIPDADGVEPFNQDRQINLTAGIAGDVGGNNNNRLTRPESGKTVTAGIKGCGQYICRGNIGGGR